MARWKLWGFDAVPGQFVGGGLYSQTKLEPNEVAVDSVMAFSTHWAGQGYLTLTDRRLIFNAFRIFLLPFPRKGFVLEYDRVRTCRAVRKFELTPMALAPALVVTSDDGKEHIFWPAVPAQELVDELKGLIPHRSEVFR